MFYVPKTLITETNGEGASRSYLEVPAHFLESLGINGDSLVNLSIDYQDSTTPKLIIQPVMENQ